MPMIGEAVTAAMATAAKARIQDVAADLRGVMTGAKQSGMSIRGARDISLRELTEDELQRAWDAITPAFIWRPDNFCGPRAFLSAHMINRLLGTGVTGIDDTVAAAVAVQSRTFRHGVGAHGGYQYHGFPVVRVQGRDGLWALDPRNFDRPVPASMVVEQVHGRAPLQVWSPIQNSGLEFSVELDALRRGSNRYSLSQYARYVQQSWDRAAEVGEVLPRRA